MRCPMRRPTEARISEKAAPRYRSGRMALQNTQMEAVDDAAAALVDRLDAEIENNAVRRDRRI